MCRVVRPLGPSSENILTQFLVWNIITHVIFDKISLWLEAKKSKSRKISFSSGCLRGERQISSHFSLFFYQKKTMHHYMTFHHCAFWYEQPFNISWQTVVLDFVPPSTWAAYQSPQLPQPCSQYYNTSAQSRKYRQCCKAMLILPTDHLLILS